MNVSTFSEIFLNNNNNILLVLIVLFGKSENGWDKRYTSETSIIPLVEPVNCFFGRI